MRKSSALLIGSRTRSSLQLAIRYRLRFNYNVSFNEKRTWVNCLIHFHHLHKASLLNGNRLTK